jgi:3-oxoacyl-[acyl-carrier-protein] synthase III
MKARISGLGVSIPPKVVKNEELARMFNTSNEWIIQRTGIEQRQFAEEGVFCSDLGKEAALNAIEDAGINKEDVDLILFATLSPDYAFPGSGVYTQHKLGLQEIPAMDIRNQCSGFLYGLKTAVSFVESGHFKKILLIGAEVHSSAMNFSVQGRDVAVLFGDAAACAVIEPAIDDNSFIYSVHIHSDGKGANHLRQRVWDISEKPYMKPEDYHTSKIWPEMNGKAVFRFAVQRLQEAVKETLNYNELSLDDIHLVIFHQANLRINEFVAKGLNLPEEKVFNNIQYRGNTTAASIPLAIYDAQREGRLKKGDRVLIAGFGSGFTWGSSIFKL